MTMARSFGDTAAGDRRKYGARTRRRTRENVLAVVRVDQSYTPLHILLERRGHGSHIAWRGGVVTLDKPEVATVQG